MNNYHGDVVLLRNNLQRNNWIRLKLEGTVSNRDAIGARVTIHTSDGRQLRTIRGGSGYLSKEPCVAHFGLGQVAEIDEVEIHWPSGKRETRAGLSINREHVLVEPGD